MYKTFSIGDVLGYGFNTLFEQIKLYLVSFLAVIGVLFAWFVAYVIVVGTVLLITSSTAVLHLIIDEKICMATFMLLPASVLAISSIFSILFLLILAGLIAGIIQLSLNIHDTNNGSVADIFTRFYLAPRLIGAAILYLLIILGGLMLFIIPGIYWLGRFRLFAYIIVDQEVGIIEALKLSYAATKYNGWRVFAIHFILQLIAGLPLVGVFCLLFLGPLVYVEIYRKLTQQPIIPPAIPI